MTAHRGKARPQVLLAAVAAAAAAGLSPSCAIADWSNQQLDTNSGWRSSVVQDFTGNLHALYFNDSIDGFLERDESNNTWSAGTSYPNGGGNLVTDHKGQVQLAFTDGHSVVLHTRSVLGNWTTSTVTSGANTSEWAAVGFDALDHPYVAYVDTSAQALKLATRNGSSWQSQTVATGSSFQYSNSGASMAVSGDGTVDFAWPDVASDTLQFTKPSGVGGWTTTAIATSYGAQLAFDRKDVLHAAYTVSGNTVAGSPTVFATYSGSAWTSQNVGPQAEAVSLAFDAHNTPHIAYMSPVAGGLGDFETLYSATSHSGSWVSAPVSSTSPEYDGPQTSSILPDQNGGIDILYADGNEILRLAKSTPLPATHTTSMTPLYAGQAVADGASFYINTSSAPMGISVRQTTGATEDRGVMEFNLADMVKGATVTKVKLELNLAGYETTEGEYPAMDVYGYAGNGFPDPSKVSTLTNVIGASGAISNLGELDIYLDPTYVQSLLDSGDDVLGLVEVADVPDLFSSFWSAPPLGGALGPTLVITATPEPTSLALLALGGVGLLMGRRRRFAI